MQKATVKAFCVMLAVWCIGLASTTVQGAEEDDKQVTITGRLLEERDDNDKLSFTLFAASDYYQLILTDEQLVGLTGLGMTRVKVTGTVTKDENADLVFRVNKFEVVEEEVENVPEEEDPIVVE